MREYCKINSNVVNADKLISVKIMKRKAVVNEFYRV